ncbi:MAG: hypothetical protein GY708_26055, partial [Actinomycetia bacterium]|nr:hypothetical protein [Actinomycetes bacterium]
ADKVSYLVVEEGLWTIDGVQVEAQTYVSTVTDSSSSWVGQIQSLSGSFTAPVVLGQVMSSNDPSWSVFWDRGVGGRGQPPSSTALITGKTVGQDPDATRADETIGFVVVEAGHGTIGGVEFEAGLGADIVQGVGNNPPYVYSFTTAFDAAPQVAVVSMAGVDGAAGGWANVHGGWMSTPTDLFVSIDEDALVDAERRHTTEQVAYVVFATTGPITCAVDSDCSDGLVCNGTETCSNGSCLPGAPVDCDDGITCTLDSCIEETGSCDNVPIDAICDDGLFCTGVETCDALQDCQAGSDPCPGETCDEGADACTAQPSAPLEFGVVTVGGSPVTVSLDNAYTSPVIVSAVQYHHNSVPVVTRISNVT